MLKIDGVAEITKNLETGEAIVLLEPDARPTRARFLQAVMDAGLTMDRIEMPY